MTFTARTELLLGANTVAVLRQQRVLLVGVGGVGGWVAEALARTGIGHLTLVDGDTICESNINRQLVATYSTLGKKKVTVLRERLRDINPSLSVEAHDLFFSAATARQFDLNSYHYIVDCIDNVADKVLLLTLAARSTAHVFAAMGAARRIDPRQVHISPFSEIQGCPLAKALRKRLRKEGETLDKTVMCVFSTEQRENKAPTTETTNGSVAPLPAIFGNTLAALILQDIIAKEESQP